MAVVGYLGKSAMSGVIFTVSPDVVKTLKNFQWNGSARYAVHQRHNDNALTEFTGLNPDQITFDMTLSHELGVTPTDEIETFFSFEREGAALIFMLGDKVYGKNRWSIVSHKTKAEHYDKHGNLYTATLSVSLQEYLDGGF